MSSENSAKSLSYCLVALALTVIMPSSDSIWIDEAQTWKAAVIPEFAAWFRALCANPFSEALMPLGMFFAWLSAKLIGTGEWQLRSINILWTALGVIAFWRIGKAMRAPWAPLLFVVQPFVWFYANEARPYSLQIACGAWLLAELVEGLNRGSFTCAGLVSMALSSLFLVGSTLFGMVTVAAAGVALSVLCRRGTITLPACYRWIAVALFCGCLAFGFYYLGALGRGAEGARLWSVGAANLAFSVFEFGGFAGLGPPREELRELAQSHGMSGTLGALTPYFPGLLLLAGVLGVCVLRGFSRSEDEGTVKRGRTLVLLTLGVILSVWASTVVLALVAHFPFWGRHLAPTFPFYVGLLVLASAAWREGQMRSIPWVFAALSVLLLVSSLRLRFASEYRKDDYRAAAKLTGEAAASGKVVWWVADPDAAAYYGLTSSREEPSNIAVLTRPTAAQIAAQPSPALIVLSKPDIYDQFHAVRDHISASGYREQNRVKSFTLWGSP